MKPTIAWNILSLFILVVGGLGLFAGMSRAVGAAASADWPTTEGTVTYAQMERLYRPRTNGRSGEMRYSLDLRYSYTVDDQNYTGTQIAFADPPGEEDEVEAALAEYPAGERVTVYYDPANPAKAVLEPGASLGTYTPFFVGIPAILIGLGMIVYGVIRRRQISEAA